MLKTKLIILSFLFVAGVILIFAFQADGKNENNLCLEDSYEIYKTNFMSQDGRIIDYSRDSITTSEGQSYMLLRSLIMNDKPTFDLVFQWTKNNLQRPDKLFSWSWGKTGQEYKILDENSASDADVDIAFALILACEKWNQNSYLDESLSIVRAIWDKETRRIDNYLVLMPGVEQTNSEKIEINPSYFSPYAFKLFHKYDDLHDWSLLVDSSYHYLAKSSEATESGLFPDWFLIENNRIVLENSTRSDFSYDAIRVFPRVLWDYVNTGDKRALSVLKKSKIFINQWNNTKTLYTNYQPNGKLRNKHEFIGAIALLVPVIDMFDKITAQEIYDEKLIPIIQNESYWSSKNDYYGKNLTWFALYWIKGHLGQCEIKKAK